MRAWPRSSARLPGDSVTKRFRIGNLGQVDAAATEIEGVLGPIDVWVNVAYTSVFAPFEEITPEEFRRVTEVTDHGAHGEFDDRTRS